MLEGGHWSSRGRAWPEHDSLVSRLQRLWEAANPDKELRDEAIVDTWQALYPNLMTTALDIAGLFRDLGVSGGDDDDPTWFHIGSVRVLLPRRVLKLMDRLPGLHELLTFASNRMRPIIVVQPTADQEIIAGQPFEIKWFIHPRIVNMMAKALECEVEDLRVEIGWVPAGTGNFKPNISKSLPMQQWTHVWQVPAHFKPRRYWLAVRLIPFESTQVEGAGPTEGSFCVVAPPFEPDEGHVETLTGMGFTGDQATTALRKAHRMAHEDDGPEYQLELATEWLLLGMDVTEDADPNPASGVAEGKDAYGEGKYEGKNEGHYDNAGDMKDVAEAKDRASAVVHPMDADGSKLEGGSVGASGDTDVSDVVTGYWRDEKYGGLGGTRGDVGIDGRVGGEDKTLVETGAPGIAAEPMDDTQLPPPPPPLPLDIWEYESIDDETGLRDWFKLPDDVCRHLSDKVKLDLHETQLKLTVKDGPILMHFNLDQVGPPRALAILLATALVLIHAHTHCFGRPSNMNR